MTVKKRCLLIAFAILALAQLSVPLYMAWHWENILKTGLPFYWVTAPVDPYDAFRGRYVDLRFKENKGLLAEDSLNVPLIRDQVVYAILETDSEGRAFIQEVSVNRPISKPYVKSKFLYKPNLEENCAVISLPFKRYYLPEELAVKAETEMFRRAGKKDAVALVRIKDGYGVIEDIYFEDKSLIKYLREKG